MLNRWYTLKLLEMKIQINIEVNTIVVSIRDVVVELGLFAVLRMFLAMSLFFSMFPEDLVFSKIGFDSHWLFCSSEFL
jgi:hypothetical protein